MAEDFDCSAITYNIANGLASGPHNYGERIRFPSNTLPSAGWWDDYNGLSVLPNFLMFSAQELVEGGAVVYGLRLRFSRGGFCTNVTGRITSNVTAISPQTPRAWIDYHNG